MNEREQTVYKARLAEQSERYDGKDTHFSALLYVVLSSVCGMCAAGSSCATLSCASIANLELYTEVGRIAS